MILHDGHLKKDFNDIHAVIFTAQATVTAIIYWTFCKHGIFPPDKYPYFIQITP